MTELTGENNVLKELQQIHHQLDQGVEVEGFRREKGLLIYQDCYYIGVESKLKIPLLSEFHDTPSAGHGGIKKMLVGLSTLFYWKGMRKSVQEYVKKMSCVSTNQKCDTGSRRIVTTVTNAISGVGRCFNGFYYWVAKFQRFDSDFCGGGSVFQVCTLWAITD